MRKSASHKRKAEKKTKPNHEERQAERARTPKKEEKNGRPKADERKAGAKRQKVKVKSVEDRLCWKIVGVGLLAFAMFIVAALLSFDWRSVSVLCAKPEPTTNLIGVAGNMFAYWGYKALGLAAWCLPVALLVGGLKLLEPIPKEVEDIPNGRVWLRVCGHGLLLLVVTGLFQLAGHWTWVQEMMANLHVGKDAGGWVGRIFMTNGLEKMVAAFGATFLSFMLLALALCMALGLKTVRKLFDWHLPDFGEWASDAAEDLGEIAAESAKIVKETAKKLLPEEPMVEPPKIIRAERKPSPKIKFPVNAQLPPLSLLNPVPPKQGSANNMQAMGEELMRKLNEFGVVATLAYTTEGPTVTQFAIQPGQGVRVDKITSLAKDLQLALEAKSLRVFAPIPGEKAVGIQVSNPHPQAVFFREIIESAEWQNKATWPKAGQPKYPLPLLLGADVRGETVMADLTKMPHLLVAGASGKGKSVCLNAIINGLLMTRTPEQLRLILVDPKRTEFSSYETLPHLLIPVVVDVKKVVGALRWAAKEMERRLVLFASAKARDIIEFNASGGEKVPYIVVVIDEVADIMTQCGRDVEPVLGRLMALARATGIHLILATQRPDVKTISGTIKANIPGRVALGTTNLNDSRTILDEGGAELLVGKGDMLYKSEEGLVRTQGALVVKDEMNRILDFVVKQWPSQIDESILDEVESESEGDGKEDKNDGEGGITEEEYNTARQIVLEANRASISMLQQRMRIGYNHASRMIDLLEKRGVVGPHRGAGPREVIG